MQASTTTAAPRNTMHVKNVYFQVAEISRGHVGLGDYILCDGLPLQPLSGKLLKQLPCRPSMTIFWYFLFILLGSFLTIQKMFFAHVKVA